MPIHDQGYRRYAGRRAPHGRTWWVIARAGIMERIHERRFLALLIFAWSLFLFYAVRIYAGATIAQARFFAATADTFHDFLSQQRLFVFFITVYAGAGLIANDRQSNALQLYLSRPITRHDYIGGKLLALALFLASVTWLPAMLLVLLQVLFSGSIDLLLEHPRLIPAVTLASILQILLASTTMMALSSLSKSRRFAAMLYAGVVLFAAALARVLEGATGNPAWVLLSPQNTLLLINDAIFGVAARDALPVAIAAVAFVLLLGACVFILERRVRAVDVVA